MKLEDTVQIDAPPDRVWLFLNDVPRVVPCLPGAELIEVVGEDAWKAQIAVKLGPIALKFASDVRRAEIDEEARTVQLAIAAREAKGRGSARATVVSSVAEQDGGTRIEIVTDLVLQGAVAQYGRGLVGDVAAQMTRQFADCVGARLGDEPQGGLPTGETASLVAGVAAAADATATPGPTTPTAGHAAGGAAPRPAPVPGLRLLAKALWARLGRWLRRRA
jgi:carbon monoxide dehydrogenase subunit G